MGQVPGERGRRRVRACSTPPSWCRACDARLDAHRRRHHLRRPATTAPSPSSSASSAPSPTGVDRGRTSCSPGPSSRCVPRVARCSPACARGRCPTTPRRRVALRRPAARVPRRQRTPRPGSRAGFDATEIGLLTELYWGLPMRSYSRTRAWTDAQFDAAHAPARVAGLVDDGRLHRRPGAARARDIEVHTDAQMRPRIEALGDDTRRAARRSWTPWGATVRAGKATRPSGPHDLASRPRPRSARVRCRSMILTDARRASTPTTFADRTGWEPKPQGLCRGEVCVPAPGCARAPTARSTSRSPPHASACPSSTTPSTACGPSARPRSAARALTTAAAADPELLTRDGNPFRLSSPARPKGAARRLGQLLRLSHQPARVAGAPHRTRTARAHRRHRRPRRRTGAHAPSGSTPAAPTHPQPDRHARTSPTSCSGSSTSRWPSGSTRPAPSCVPPKARRIERSPLRDMDIPEGLPERIDQHVHAR